MQQQSSQKKGFTKWLAEFRLDRSGAVTEESPYVDL